MPIFRGEFPSSLSWSIWCTQHSDIAQASSLRSRQCEEVLTRNEVRKVALCISQDSRWFSATWQSWTTDDSSGGAAAYARLAERAIVQSLLRQTPNPSSAQTSLRDPDFNPGFEGVCSEESSLPRHFLGALAASAQGLEVLRSCHVLQIAASKLLDSAAGELDRRGAAWSLGHVAARGGAAAGHVIETGGLANLERGVRGAVGNLGLRGTILQALTLAASSPGVRTWLSERKWVTQTDEDEEKSDVEKDSRALYGSLFDGSKGAAVGTSESGPERWDSDSTVESLGGFLKEPIPDAETETAFYDQLFGVSKSKEIPAVPAESRSTHSETKALVGIDDASGQPGFAVQGGEERVEKMELPACICLPKSPSILFTLPSDRTLDCASHYRATLRRATNKERSRVAKVFPEEGSEGDPSIEAPHATVATTSGVAKGEQIKPSRDGESAFPNIGAPAEGGTLTELPSSTESAASASGTESPAPDGAAPRASGAEPSSAAADGTASETLVTTAAMTGSDQRTSGTGSSGNGMEQRPSGTGAGAADEASEVRAERKALALLNGLCNPVTAVGSHS